MEVVYLLRVRNGRVFEKFGNRNLWYFCTFSDNRSLIVTLLSQLYHRKNFLRMSEEEERGRQNASTEMILFIGGSSCSL